MQIAVLLHSGGEGVCVWLVEVEVVVVVMMVVMMVVVVEQEGDVM